MSENSPAGLSGNFRIVCAFDPKRGTHLAAQSFCAPMHLGKAYWNGEILLVNVINQTAGVFGGDRVTTEVVVQSGARVLLASPSATRFHPSQGREARLEQTFDIGAGGFLDVHPEITIPQRDSRSFQKTIINVERGGEMLYLETLAPGRVASGESFAFESVRWWTDIRYAGRLVLRERACVSPYDLSTAGLTALFPASYYAGLVLVSPASENWKSDFQHAVAMLGDEVAVKIAASKLIAGGWSIRLLAGDGLTLRKTIQALRQLIYERLGKPFPDLRRA